MAMPTFERFGASRTTLTVLARRRFPCKNHVIALAKLFGLNFVTTRASFKLLALAMASDVFVDMEPEVLAALIDDNRAVFSRAAADARRTSRGKNHFGKDRYDNGVGVGDGVAAELAQLLALRTSDDAPMSVDIIEEPLVADNNPTAWFLVFVGDMAKTTGFAQRFLIVQAPFDILEKSQQPGWQPVLGLPDGQSFRKAFDCPTGYKSVYCFGPVTLDLVTRAVDEGRKIVHQWPDGDARVMRHAARCLLTGQCEDDFELSDDRS